MAPRYSIIAAIAVGLACITGTAWSAGSDDPAPVKRMSLSDAKDRIDRKDWGGAIDRLTTYIRDNPRSADAYNYLGYSHRKLGRLDKAKRYYDKALALDPEHRGAHEYLGELYIQKGDMARARTQLTALRQLCPRGCDEYDMLKKAVETGRWN